ncbi:hypothetical protein JL720_10765 [Aureococcus anophagefferens]|nr:hypothetical protein JL720_10765 [Aureococcus anophagefferens]
MAAVLRFAKASPMAFGVGFSCLKTSASDLIVQTFVERRETIDWKRNAAFASFGFGYLGIVQYSLYVPVFGRLFPKTEAFAAKSLREKMADLPGTLGVAAQVFLDHPMWMRIPVVASTSLVWTMILSAMRGTEEVEDGAAAFVGEEEDAAGGSGGGNITGSKMLRMNDEFTVILHVVPPAELEKKLDKLREDLDCKITVTWS